MTPVFSYLLSRLLFEVSEGGTNIKLINRFGGILLLVCAFDGLFLGGKYVIMEVVSTRWVTKMRENALERVLAQDKAWFDGYSPRSSSSSAETTTTATQQHTLAYDPICYSNVDEGWG
jgi:ATP-binding cassette, subfamily B (MDR/TAP), member 1